MLDRLDLSISDFNYAFFVFFVYSASWFSAYFFIGQKVRKRKRIECLMRGRRLAPPLVHLLLGVGVGIFLMMFFNHPARNLIQAGRSGLTAGIYGKLFFLVIALVLALYPISITSYLMFRTKTSARQNKHIFSEKLMLAFFIVSSSTLAFALIQLEGKSRALFPFIITLILWHYYINRLSFRFFFLTILSLVGSALFVDVALLGAQFSISNPLDSLFGLDARVRTFDGLYNLAKLIKHCRESQEFSFFWGQTMIADLLSDAGVQLETTSRAYLMNTVYGFPDDIKFSFPISKPGEFFLNFGWFGIILGGCGLGALSRWCYFYLVQGKALSGASIPVYVTLIYSLGIATPIGYFAQALAFNIISIVILFGLWMSLQGGGKLSWKKYR